MGLKSITAACVLAATVALPGSASPTGDASWSLASYSAMERPALSPSDRVLAVYRDSAARAEMLDRLRARYPVLAAMGL